MKSHKSRNVPYNVSLFTGVKYIKESQLSELIGVNLQLSSFSPNLAPFEPLREVSFLSNRKIGFALSGDLSETKSHKSRNFP